MHHRRMERDFTELKNLNVENIHKWMSFHTHVSKKLSGVLKVKVLRVGVDQHSRGVDFGSIGYLS